MLSLVECRRTAKTFEEISLSQLAFCVATNCTRRKSRCFNLERIAAVPRGLCAVGIWGRANSAIHRTPCVGRSTAPGLGSVASIDPRFDAQAVQRARSSCTDWRPGPFAVDEVARVRCLAASSRSWACRARLGIARRAGTSGDSTERSRPGSAPRGRHASIRESRARAVPAAGRSAPWPAGSPGGARPEAADRQSPGPRPHCG